MFLCSFFIVIVFLKQCFGGFSSDFSRSFTVIFSLFRGWFGSENQKHAQTSSNQILALLYSPRILSFQRKTSSQDLFPLADLCFHPPGNSQFAVNGRNPPPSFTRPYGPSSSLQNRPWETPSSGVWLLGVWRKLKEKIKVIYEICQKKSAEKDTFSSGNQSMLL